jgi:hypothetical protein
MSKHSKSETKSEAGEKKKYTKGEALVNTVADLNAANFKNKDVQKWTEIRSNQERTPHQKLRGLASLNQQTKLPRYNKKK